MEVPPKHPFSFGFFLVDHPGIQLLGYNPMDGPPESHFPSTQWHHHHDLSLKMAEICRGSSTASTFRRPPVQGRTPRPHLALDAGRHQLGQDVAGPQGTDAVPPPGLLWGWYTELFRKLGYPNSWLVYKGESEKFNG